MTEFNMDMAATACHE